MTVDTYAMCTTYFKTTYLKTQQNNIQKEPWFLSTNITFILKTDVSNLESYCTGVSLKNSALWPNMTQINQKQLVFSLTTVGPLSIFWQPLHPICFDLEIASQRN